MPLRKIFLFWILSFNILHSSLRASENCRLDLKSAGESASTYSVFPTPAQAARIAEILRLGDRSPDVNLRPLGLIESFDAEKSAPEHFISLYLYIYQNSFHAPYLRLQSLRNIVYLYHFQGIVVIKSAIQRMQIGKTTSPDRLTPFDLFEYSFSNVKTLKDFNPLKAAEASRVLDQLVASGQENLEARDRSAIYDLTFFEKSTEAQKIAFQLKKLFDQLKDYRSKYYTQQLLLLLFQDSKIPEGLNIIEMESPVLQDLRNSKSYIEFKAAYDMTRGYTFGDDARDIFDAAFDNGRFSEARLLASRLDKRSHYIPTKIAALLEEARKAIDREPNSIFESDILFVGKFGLKEDKFLLERLQATTGEKYKEALKKALRDLESRYDCEDGTCDPYAD